MLIKKDFIAKKLSTKSVIIEHGKEAVVSSMLKARRSISITASAKRISTRGVTSSNFKSRGLAGRTITVDGLVDIRGKVLFEKTDPASTSFIELSALELARASRAWQHVSAVDAVPWTRLTKEDEGASEGARLRSAMTGCKGLGGPCQLGPHVAVADIPIPQPHSQLHLTALVHYFGLWTDETLYAKVDGEYVWTNAQRQGADTGLTLPGCGTAQLGDALDMYLPHSTRNVTVEFGSLSTRDACQQSWAFEHVVVEVR